MKKNREKFLRQSFQLVSDIEMALELRNLGYMFGFESLSDYLFDNWCRRVGYDTKGRKPTYWDLTHA